MLGSDVTAILKAAVDSGFSLIPVGLDKRPRVSTWKPYQARRPTVSYHLALSVRLEVTPFPSLHPYL